MIIKIYNTVTQKKEIIDFNNLSIYNCGPTVYNHIHIGNLRSFLTIDFLIKILNAKSIPFTYVSNITDIDDKIIDESIKENCSELEIIKKYTDSYINSLNQMQITLPHVMPTILDNIDGIIEYIKKIHKTKSTYIFENNLYFDINKVLDYGIISKQKQLSIKNYSRIKGKSDALSNDFVLWKSTNKGLNWKTTWSQGRPGWHSECSFFINKFIGEQTTIHAGGVDLKFPHHENENAQNMCLLNKPIAKIWMHIGHLKINGKKMSKSLNNSIFVKDILQIFSPNVIRLFFMTVHYTKPINYSENNIISAKNIWNKINQLLNRIQIHLYLNNHLKSNNISLNESFINEISNDLNLPNILTLIQSWKSSLMHSFKSEDFVKTLKYWQMIRYHLSILGFKLRSQEFNAEEIVKIKLWDQHIKSKNYSESDKLLKELIE